MFRRSIRSVCLSFFVSIHLSCSHADRIANVTDTAKRVPNGAVKVLSDGDAETNQRNAPYVVLVSIDGYRWDFNQLFDAKELTSIQREGASAETLLPIYPSKTFPNHYSLVTGLYANHHGLVSNEFYDPTRDATYALSDRAAVQNGDWYGGEPLWITARKQGLLTASFFWVGSEARIAGYRPHYYLLYDDSIPEMRRVDQVLDWLDLPEPRRPHFITLYFSAVDLNAHREGITSPKVAEAVQKVDRAVAYLRDGVRKRNLPINLIFVSDHGLEDVDPKKMVRIDEDAQVASLLAKFSAVGRGPQMLLYLKKNESSAVVEQTRRLFNRKVKNVRALTPHELKILHYDGNARTGDLVLNPDPNYMIGFGAAMPKAQGANHGWDETKARSMHGIFFAEGPAFKPGSKVPSFENIHVYPLIARILGLEPAAGIDGRIEPVAGLLKD